MAPNLTVAQRQRVAALINANQLSNLQIAAQVPCTDRAVRRIRTNLQLFGRPTDSALLWPRSSTDSHASCNAVCMPVPRKDPRSYAEGTRHTGADRIWY